MLQCILTVVLCHALLCAIAPGIAQRYLHLSSVDRPGLPQGSWGQALYRSVRNIPEHILLTWGGQRTQKTKADSSTRPSGNPGHNKIPDSTIGEGAALQFITRDPPMSTESIRNPVNTPETAPVQMHSEENHPQHVFTPHGRESTASEMEKKKSTLNPHNDPRSPKDLKVEEDIKWSDGGTLSSSSESVDAAMTNGALRRSKRQDGNRQAVEGRRLPQMQMNARGRYRPQIPMHRG